jgi:hypothetical protein
MQLFGGLKDKISGIYGKAKGAGESLIGSEQNLDYEDIKHTLNVLKDENNILKNKIRVLENSVLGDNQSSSNTQFGKIFKDLKSTFSFSAGQQVDSRWEFKKFLCDNLLFYNNIDEDDIDYLNSVQLSEEDWEKSKDLFIFKQKILEKNYAEMFKNIFVSKELDQEINRYKPAQTGASFKDVIHTPENKSTVKEVKSNIEINNNHTLSGKAVNMSKMDNKIGSAFFDNNLNNINQDKSNKNILPNQKKKNEYILNALEEKLLDVNINQIKEQIKSPKIVTNDKINEVNNSVNKDNNNVLNQLQNFLIHEDDDDLDFSSVFKKENKVTIPEVKVHESEKIYPESSDKVSTTKSLDLNKNSDKVLFTEQTSNNEKIYNQDLNKFPKIDSTTKTQQKVNISNFPTGEVTTVKFILPKKENKKKDEAVTDLESS